MKKFDISNLAVLDIDGLYKSCLAMDSEARAVARTSMLIIKQTGRTSYTVKDAKIKADSENILFFLVVLQFDPGVVLGRREEEKRRNGAGGREMGLGGRTEGGE